MSLLLFGVKNLSYMLSVFIKKDIQNVKNRLLIEVWHILCGKTIKVIVFAVNRWK